MDVRGSQITSSRFCADFEGTFVTSNPRASIFERNSTSSSLVNASTWTIQVIEKNLLEDTGHLRETSKE